MIEVFIESYSESSRTHIDFAWNGRHSDEFADSNQEFRWEVARRCIATPDRASVLLLEHLFLADAEWAREARRPPEHFAQLGSTLLNRGELTAVSPFLKGLVHSFDTLGSSHEIRLPAGLVVRLRQAAEESLSTENEEQRQALEDVLELFGKRKKRKVDDVFCDVRINHLCGPGRSGQCKEAGDGE